MVAVSTLHATSPIFLYTINGSLVSQTTLPVPLVAMGITANLHFLWAVGPDFAYLLRIPSMTIVEQKLIEEGTTITCGCAVPEGVLKSDLTRYSQTIAVGSDKGILSHIEFVTEGEVLVRRLSETSV